VSVVIYFLIVIPSIQQSRHWWSFY